MSYLRCDRGDKSSCIYLDTKEEVEKIGKEKFEEWNIQDYSSSQISLGWNDKWRN